MQVKWKTQLFVLGRMARVNMDVEELASLSHASNLKY